MWVILGGNGQLGQSFAEVLTQSSTTYRIVGRETADITDLNSVRHLLTELQPKVVVNCAAWTAVDNAEDHEKGAFLINADGARHIAIASKEINARLVHISTDYVFPGTDVGPYSETSATGPVSAYGRSKLAGEKAVLEEYPENSLIVRTAWLYSKYRANFVKTMVRKCLQNAPVKVVNDQLGQPTLATDLARHIENLVAHPNATGIFHGTNSGSATWCDLTVAIYNALGADTSLVTPVPSSEYPTKATRPKNSVLGHQHTIDLGVSEMRPWDAALKSCIGEIKDVIEKELCNEC